MVHDVCVSIINYRTADMTLECVRSVLADLTASEGIDVHIVVIDNASGDGSADRIADWIAAQPSPCPVSILRSKTNSGFSGGHNQVMASCRARYYLLLNSDALLKPGFLRSVLAVADTDPRAGLVSPRLENTMGVTQPNTFRAHSPLSELIRGAGSAQVTRLLRNYVVALEPGMLSAADTDRIDWVSFACVLLRSSMVDEIGPMDEGYFLYFEDTEYCLRARRAGWTFALAPQATARHHQGGSGPVESSISQRRRLPAYYYRSRSRYFAQTYGRAGLIAANLMWYLGRAVALLRPLAGRSVPRAIESEARDIWTSALSPLADRPASDPRRI